jgi:hypothetical protein
MRDFLLNVLDGLEDGRYLPALAAMSVSIILLFLHWIMFRTGIRARELASLIESQVEPWLKEARHKHRDDFKPKDDSVKSEPKPL